MHGFCSKRRAEFPVKRARFRSFHDYATIAATTTARATAKAFFPTSVAFARETLGRATFAPLRTSLAALRSVAILSVAIFAGLIRRLSADVPGTATAAIRGYPGALVEHYIGRLEQNTAAAASSSSSYSSYCHDDSS
jgi:hypothetical protein